MEFGPNAADLGPAVLDVGIGALGFFLFQCLGAWTWCTGSRNSGVVSCLGPSAVDLIPNAASLCPGALDVFRGVLDFCHGALDLCPVVLHLGPGALDLGTTPRILTWA